MAIETCSICNERKLYGRTHADVPNVKLHPGEKQRAAVHISDLGGLRLELHVPVYLRVSTVFAELDRVGDTGERLLLDVATGERLYWGDVICGGMDLTLVRVQAENAKVSLSKLWICANH